MVRTILHINSSDEQGGAARIASAMHLHNLHGTYFDLRALPPLSRELPVVVTLHDMWLLTGHCAHAVGCPLWQTGCAVCPCPPRRHRAGPAAVSRNWRRKKEILQRCRLSVITPSQWLMDRVAESYLGPAVREGRVIPNGVDVAIFHPGERGRARAQLELPAHAWILLFSAHEARRNPWKDYECVRRAAAALAERATPRQTILLVLGDDGGPAQEGLLAVRHIPYVADDRVVADYYRAADLYLHAAHADTFPTTILESLACGTPVVATAVGGIPEQVKSLSLPIPGALGRGAREDATGVLTRPGDFQAMAEAGLYLLQEEELRGQISRNARREATRCFTSERQAQEYLRFYETVLARAPEAPPRTTSLSVGLP